jgi:hypothetical protein
MLSSQVLAMLRAKAAQFFTDTCTIEAESLARGKAGEPTHARVTVATGVPCRVIDSTNRQTISAQLVGGQEAIVDTYRIITPYGTALAVDQIITVSSGEEYHVVGLITARTDKVDAQAVVRRAR